MGVGVGVGERGREKAEKIRSSFLTLFDRNLSFRVQIAPPIWSLQWSGTGGPAKGRSLIRRRNGPWPPTSTPASKVILSAFSIIHSLGDFRFAQKQNNAE